MIEKAHLVKTKTIRGEALTGEVEPHSSPECEPGSSLAQSLEQGRPSPFNPPLKYHYPQLLSREYPISKMNSIEYELKQYTIV